MGKSFVATCVSLVVLAAIALVPAAASAVNDPDLTEGKGGPLVPVETKVLGTSIGNMRTTSSPGTANWECSAALLTGTVAKNNGTSLEATINTLSFSGTGANGECTGAAGGFTFNTNGESGVPWCLQSDSSMTDDSFQIRGNACNLASRAITITTSTTTVGKCLYKRFAAIPGTYDTEATGDAILHLSMSNSGRWKVPFSARVLSVSTSHSHWRRTHLPPLIPSTSPRS